MILSLLVACDVLVDTLPEGELGHAYPCLESDADARGPFDGGWDDGDPLYQVTGTLLEDDGRALDELQRCWFEGGETALVEDLNGGVWRVGWNLLDADDNDLTPATDLVAGDTVSLIYRIHIVWGEAGAFALSDDRGLAVAVDSGGFGEQILTEDDLGGIVVSESDHYAITEDTCGDMRFHELEFEHDTSAITGSVDHASFESEGVTLDAWNLGTYHWVDDGDGVSCSDTFDRVSYAIVR